MFGLLNNRPSAVIQADAGLVDTHFVSRLAFMLLFGVLLVIDVAQGLIFVHGDWRSLCYRILSRVV